MQGFWEDLVRARWKLMAAEELPYVLRLIQRWSRIRDFAGAERRFESAAYAAEFVSQAYFKIERLEPAGWNRCFSAAYWLKGGRPERALECLNDAPMRLDPESEGEIRARAHCALGRPGFALAALHRAVLVAKTPKLLDLRARIYRDLGADEECIRDLAESLRLRARAGEQDLELGIARLLEIAEELCRRKEAVELIRVAGLLRRRPRR